MLIPIFTFLILLYCFFVLFIICLVFLFFFFSWVYCFFLVLLYFFWQVHGGIVFSFYIFPSWGYCLFIVFFYVDIVFLIVFRSWDYCSYFSFIRVLFLPFYVSAVAEGHLISLTVCTSVLYNIYLYNFIWYASEGHHLCSMDIFPIYFSFIGYCFIFLFIWGKWFPHFSNILI